MLLPRNFYVTERDRDGYFTLTWTWRELPTDIQQLIKQALIKGENKVKNARQGDFIEITWD